MKAESFTWTINKKVSCHDSNLIYLIQCDKERCKKTNIGLTTKELRERMCQHLGYVRNKTLSKANGEHFNLPGHDKDNMRFTILEKSEISRPLTWKEKRKISHKKIQHILCWKQ